VKKDDQSNLTQENSSSIKSIKEGKAGHLIKDENPQLLTDAGNQIF
jgi:hypothetical protein